MEVYDLENPGDRIIGNDDSPLERIREGIRSLRSVVYFLSPGYTARNLLDETILIFH